MWSLFLMSSRNLIRISLPTALICSLLAALGCERRDRIASDIADQIHSLSQETVRPGGTLESPVSIGREFASITADWQVKDTGSGKEYFGWIKDRLKQDYKVESESGPVLVLHKEGSGDSYILEFRDGTAGTRPDSEINIHFIAMAD